MPLGEVLFVIEAIYIKKISNKVYTREYTSSWFVSGIQQLAKHITTLNRDHQNNLFNASNILFQYSKSKEILIEMQKCN